MLAFVDPVLLLLIGHLGITVLELALHNTALTVVVLVVTAR